MGVFRVCVFWLLAITCCIAENRERKSFNFRRQLWDSEGLASNADPSLQSENKGDIVKPEVKKLIEELSSKSYYDDGVSRVIERRRRAVTQVELRPSADMVMGNKDRMPVAYKCCPVGQNLTRPKQDFARSPIYSASLTGSGGSPPFEVFEGDPAQRCAPSDLPFEPLFMETNDTSFWDVDTNVWETIVGNPCIYDKYNLDPQKNSEDEFYLFANGSIFAPMHKPILLNPGDYCLETFSTPTGYITLPLVCFLTPPPKQENSSTWMTIIAVVMLLSLPFLVVTSLTHFLVEEIKCAHSFALGCHSACLAVAYLTLSISQLAPGSVPNVMCTVGAYIIQGSFLACFMWLNVMCIDTCLYILKPYNSNSSNEDVAIEKKRIIYYNICAWTISILFTLITALAEYIPGVPFTFHKPNIGNTGCWFESDSSAFFYFYLPVMVILIFNLVILIFAKLLTSKSQSTVPPNRKLKKTIFRCTALYVLMSMAWMLEFVSWWQSSESFIWFVSDLVNASQGVVVFLIFMRPTLIKKVINKLQSIIFHTESPVPTTHESELMSITANVVTNGTPSTPV